MMPVSMSRRSESLNPHRCGTFHSHPPACSRSVPIDRDGTRWTTLLAVDQSTHHGHTTLTADVAYPSTVPVRLLPRSSRWASGGWKPTQPADCRLSRMPERIRSPIYARTAAPHGSSSTGFDDAGPGCFVGESGTFCELSIDVLCTPMMLLTLSGEKLRDPAWLLWVPGVGRPGATSPRPVSPWLIRSSSVTCNA